MRLSSGKCVVWSLIAALVATMLWLHTTLLVDEGADTPVAGALGRMAVERTSENWSDIKGSIHGVKTTVPLSVPTPTSTSEIESKNLTLSSLSGRPVSSPTTAVAGRAPVTISFAVESQLAPELTDANSAKTMANLRSVELSENYQQTFRKHLSYDFPRDIALDEYMLGLSKAPSCHGKPIFVTMARVKSDLYWQLIENYFFTMYRFGHTDCAVMICISDQTCVDKCKEHGFPCYDYHHDNASEPIFLQIGKLKLYYVGEAIKKGVDVMLLDLDVSFLRDPLELMEGFLDNETEHIRCQMDLIYSMNKDSNGNLYWFSHPGPNFGLFLAKSSDISKKVFKEAWRKYQKVPFHKKNRVASDQNVMSGALSSAQWRMNKIFVAYFFIGTDSDQNKRANVRRELLAPLLDKIEYYSPNHIRFELGAMAAREELKGAIAVHATCYEGSTKLLALKAVNAFWDIRYYNPMERTITKPLMLVSSLDDLRMEIRALAYIALKTNRSLLIPNILIGIGIRGKDRSRATCQNGPKLSCDTYLKEADGAWAVDFEIQRQLSAAETNQSIFLRPNAVSTAERYSDNAIASEVLMRGDELAWPFNITNRHSYHRMLGENGGQKKKKGPKKQGGIWDPKVLYHDQSHTAKNRGERYWPAFRTIHSTRSDLKVIEPSFYYRIEDDFKKQAPEPLIISMDIKGNTMKLDHVVAAVLSHDNNPRLVLDLSDSADVHSNSGRGRPRDITEWAKDPLSSWGDAVIDKRGYIFMPQFANNNKNKYRKYDILNTVYICPEFLRKEYGNRACFNKCT